MSYTPPPANAVDFDLQAYSPPVAGSVDFELGAAAQTLLPSLYTNTNTFYGPTVARGSVTLLPGLFSNANAFYGPVVARGSVTIAPPLLENVNEFYPPVVSGAVVPPIGASNPGGGGGGGGRRESPEVSQEIDRTLRKMLRAAKRGELVKDEEPAPEIEAPAANEVARVSDAVADIAKIARALVPPSPIPIYPPSLPVYIAPPVVAVPKAPDYAADDDEVLMMIYG